MKLRKRAIGDLYLAASVIFIFLSFLYFGLYKNFNYGWTFLAIGLAVALFGMKTKGIMAGKESVKIRNPKKARSKGK